jgi:hypothetical protein
VSSLIQAALTWVLIAAPGAQPPAAPSTPSKPTVPAEARPNPAGVAASAAAQPSAVPAGDPLADPFLKALRAEVERLQKRAAEAESAAPDDAGRLRARAQLNTELLLLTIRLQEQIYLQQKALLLAAQATKKVPSAASGGSAAALRAAPTKPKYVGPVFIKRNGSKKAHRPGCAFGEKIAPAERVSFASLAHAVAAGCQPCKVCRP